MQESGRRTRTTIVNSNSQKHGSEWHVPAVAVRCADVGSRAHQEVNHVVVASADGVVKGSDALVVRLAGVNHLREAF